MNRRILRLATFHYTRWYERYPFEAPEFWPYPRPLDPAAKQTPPPQRESSPAAGSSGPATGVRAPGPLVFHAGRRVA